MSEQSIITPIGEGRYQIMFPKPIKFDMDFFLQAGSHKIEVLAPDETSELVIGVQGEKEILLSWLESVGVDEDNLKSYEAAMTE